MNSSPSNSLFFKVYCLSPPDDSCDFGPCPNPDITGIGQQVSLYVTSTSLALIILYASHKNSRLSTYAHFANVYALMISALISLRQGQLTQNDAVFVLIVVASPVSIYFWVLHLMRFPKIRKVKAFKSFQDFLPTWMIFSSFVMWATMAGLILRPLSTFPFSQSACKTVQLRSTWISLLWYLLYIAQNLLLVLCCSVAPAFRPQEWKSGTSDMNIIQWTRSMLDDGLMCMTQHRIAAIIFTIQVSAIASIPGQIYQWASATLLSGLILVIVFWVSGSPGGLGLCIFSGSILGTSASDLLPTMPSSPLTVICILLHLRSVHLRPNTTAIIRFYCYFILALLVSSIPFILSLTSYRGILGATPLFIQYILWLGPWAAMRESDGMSVIGCARLLWNNVLQPAPLLKFNHLIVIPHFAWIWATISANPTPTYDLTFGQLLALFLLFIPLWTVIRMTYQQRKGIKRALWMTKIDDNMLRPGMHLMTVTPTPLSSNAALVLSTYNTISSAITGNAGTHIPFINRATQAHPLISRDTRGRANTIG